MGEITKMNTKKKEEVKTALLEINSLLVQLDPTIRASAFDILWPLCFVEGQSAPTHTPSPNKSEKSSPDGSAPSELADLVASHDHKKPADNVMLLTA